MSSVYDILHNTLKGLGDANIKITELKEFISNNSYATLQNHQNIIVEFQAIFSMVAVAALGVEAYLTKEFQDATN